MKQLLQHLSNGQTEIADVPVPRVRPGHVLVKTHRTLVSAGTERMLVEFGKANLIDKARQQPDRVRAVLEKIKTDGLLTTLDAVRSKLDMPVALGYCNVGTVVEVGPGVTEFRPGDRVVSNGPHAEIVCVPKHLCALVPESVSDDEAVFTVIGAIALQGIRLAQPTLGEAFVVTGLGLVGLMAVQLLRAHGCRVLGIDINPGRVKLAESFGVEAISLREGGDPVEAAMHFSRGRGVDAVLITASTKSSEPVHQAALMCRKRGRIVLVGVTGLELSREDFYEKELSFQVSCSYGPGRYDPNYEEKGQDYPIGYVRWTEQRNFEAVLDMMAGGQVDVKPLVSHRFAIDDAAAAYALLTSNAPSLGIVIEYPSRIESVKKERVVELKKALPSVDPGASRSSKVSFIGAGNYAGRVLIPAFRKAGASFRAIASDGGVSSAHYGRKYGFETATTDLDALFDDPDTAAVVIATRHDTHASLVVQALQAGKHVFVEKPLALTAEELADIADAYGQASGRGTPPVLMVGFNRRFSPFVVRVKSLLDSVSAPKSFIMTVNAGAIPKAHWTQDRQVGGGRIVGEACHFVDLLRHLAGSRINAAKVTSLGGAHGAPKQDDVACITLEFEDGSIGTIHYFANGHKAFPKERLEIFCNGRILILDNFRRLRAYGWPGFRPMRQWRQDKGHEACARSFLDAIRGASPPPIPFDELVEVSEWTIRIAEQALLTQHGPRAG